MSSELVELRQGFGFLKIKQNIQKNFIFVRQSGDNIYLFQCGMFCFLVFVESIFPSCLIITLVTGIYFTFMFRLLVPLKNILLCCLIFTLVTAISYTRVS